MVDPADVAMAPANKHGMNDLHTFISCSVMCIGGAILTLPLAAHRGSILVTILLIYGVSLFGAFTNTIIALAASLADSPFFSDAMAVTLTGPLSGVDTVEGASTTLLAKGGVGHSGIEEETLRRRRRTALRFFFDCFIAANTVCPIVMFIRIIADSLPHIAVRLDLGSAFQQSSTYYFPLFISLTALLSSKSLGEMAFVAVFGLVSILVVVACILGTYVTNGSSRSNYTINWVSFDRHTFQMIPLVVMAVCNQFATSNVYFEMQDRSPKRFSQICALVAWSCACVYAVAALFGYLTFGSDVALESVGGNVLNNYPDTWLWTAMRVSLIIHFFAAVPVVGFSVRLIVHRIAAGLTASPVDSNRLYESDWVSRVAASGLIIGLSAAAAALIPGIGAFLEIVGLVTAIPAFATFPCCCGIVIYSGRWAGTVAAKRSGSPDDYAPSRPYLAVCVTGFLLSIGTLVVGLAAAVAP